jgi:cytochrome c oxidase cbb3-type subunit IV
MFRNALSGIQDVAIYPIFSLIIFVAFFTALGFFVVRSDKNYIKHMEKLPFDEEK